MSQHIIRFAAACAFGHLPTYTYTSEELAVLLSTDSLTFYCGTCNVSRRPTLEECARLHARIVRVDRSS